MTAIKYVSQKEMQKETGLKTALGYAFPKEDKILIRKGLPKEKKKEVLAHEEEHIAKDEEGPWIPQAIAAAAAVLGSVISSKGAKSGAKKATQGAQAEIDFIDKWMNIARDDTQHMRQMGAMATNAMGRMTGLIPGMTTEYDENGYPVSNVSGSMLAQNAPGAAITQPNTAPIMGTPPEQYGPRFLPPKFRDNGRFLRDSAYLAGGGPMYPDTIYNINEMGPENVYSGGSISRNPNPMTIDGRTGYVEPNIEGRGLGGFLGKIASGGLKFDPVLKNLHDDYVGSGNKKQRRALRYAESQGWTSPQADQGGGGVDTDIDTTQGQDFQWQTDPGYQFRFEEGQRALDRGAAARGGLLSGGYGRKAIRYGQGFASNEYTNVYNRIANIAQLGQVANQHASNAALQGGFGMGGAAGAMGINSAYGSIGSADAWGRGLTNLGNIPWGNVFGGGGNTSSGGAVQPPAYPDRWEY
jgi:hypothetical protein